MSATPVNDDWPSHTEELTRKAMEVAERVLWQLERGEVSKREAWLILGHVWDTVSGLVHKDVMDALAQTRGSISPKPTTVRRVFGKIEHRKLRVMVLELSVGAPELLVRAGLFGAALEPRGVAKDTPAEAQRAFAALAKSLTDTKGYTEIL
ncbi:hypothetical protein [Azospirillum argentinense]|uniref:hypothetical protein n=1 Tax=Azospirillum argentinense TaxID=2970906 RepID=UPI0032DE81FA